MHRRLLNHIPFVSRYTCTPTQLPRIIERLHQRRLRPLLDYVYEPSNTSPPTAARVQHVVDTMATMGELFPNTPLAIKPSAIAYTADAAHELIERVKPHGCNVIVDAERVHDYDKYTDLVQQLTRAHNTPTQAHVHQTLQMYRRDSFDALYELLHGDTTRTHAVGVKLVRGAYHFQDSATGALYTTIDATHRNYDNAIMMFARYATCHDTLMCATHNVDSIAYAKQVFLPHNPQVSFAQLMGMSDDVSDELAQVYTTYKYVPFGNLWETVPYLVRRWYEVMVWV